MSEETRKLDGKAMSKKLRAEIAAGVEELISRGGRQPKLVAVLVGEDAASQTYVASKTKGCQEVGMAGETIVLPADISREDLLAKLDELNADDAVDGILVQLPLPKHLKEREIVNHVVPEKDVDGFHEVNVGRLWLGEPALAPATPTGVMELLKRSDIELSGKHAVIVGRSNIVGKPMASLLLREHCTVTICHSRTQNLEEICRSADIVVAAVGRTAFIGPDHVREGAVVVDVGINRVTDADEVEKLYPGVERKRRAFEKRGRIVVGDVDYHRVAPIASAITPVPGGVGPLTVTQVIGNTLTASRRRQGME